MPPVRQTLSKSRVTRAGDTIRAWWELGEEEEVTPEVLEAARVMAAWRQLHAYPLSLGTPGVRHWVSQETAGRVIVGQRLKRFDRMLDKLSRMPTLRLPQMEEIAGCRAVL